MCTMLGNEDNLKQEFSGKNFDLYEIKNNYYIYIYIYNMRTVFDRNRMGTDYIYIYIYVASCITQSRQLHDAAGMFHARGKIGIMLLAGSLSSDPLPFLRGSLWLIRASHVLQSTTPHRTWMSAVRRAKNINISPLSIAIYLPHCYAVLRVP